MSFPSPSQLGVGTASATVVLNVCSDSACTQPVSGSPITISVTYLITPDPTFYFPQPVTGFQATTSETTAQTASLEFIIQNVPLSGLWIVITQPPGGFITGLSYSEAPDTSGR